MRFEWPEFGRCCFCMPLRRGILACAYIRLIFDILLVTAVSINIHGLWYLPIYTGLIAITMEAKLCLAFSLLDFIFLTLLLYGSHMKLTRYMKAFYYYGISSTAGTVLLQLIQVSLGPYSRGQVLGLLAFSCCGVVIEVYLLLMTRSLLTKLERSGPAHYENQLNEVILNQAFKSNGEIKSGGAVDM